MRSLMCLALICTPALADVQINGSTGPGAPPRLPPGCMMAECLGPMSSHPRLSFPPRTFADGQAGPPAAADRQGAEDFGIDLSGMDRSSTELVASLPPLPPGVPPEAFDIAQRPSPPIAIYPPDPAPRSVSMLLRDPNLPESGSNGHLGPGEVLWTGTDGGEFGGFLRRRTASDEVEVWLPRPITGLAPDPENADCLLLSSGLRHMGASGGVYRLCPSRSWEPVRLPGLTDEVGAEIPVIALSGGRHGVWALTEGRLWTWEVGRWTSQALHMGQFPAGMTVVLPGFHLWRDAAGQITARPAPTSPTVRRSF